MRQTYESALSATSNSLNGGGACVDVQTHDCILSRERGEENVMCGSTSACLYRDQIRSTHVVQSKADEGGKPAPP